MKPTKTMERVLAEMAVSRAAPKRTRRRHGQLVRFRKPAGTQRLAQLRADAAIRAPKVRIALPPVKPVVITCRHQSEMLHVQGIVGHVPARRGTDANTGDRG